METLYSSPYMSDTGWFSQSTEWTREENKKFESALAIYDEHTPDRWLKIAAMIPGKTVFDVRKQYRELEDDVSDIEAGRVPIPGYLSSSLTWELVSPDNCDVYRKRSLAVKTSDQERKKGVPWTEEEHRQFLMGLLKYGKGDWRNISRNFVVSKTPTQVASHAQKYFIRQQLSGVKDKRRPSIHDITTINLTNTTLMDHNNNSFDQSNALYFQQKPTGTNKISLEYWSHKNDEAVMVLDSSDDDLFVSSRYESAANSLILQGQSLYGNAGIDSQNLAFHMPSRRYRIRG
ncbi:transcription factor DIVARICATA-like [Tripterygium wilfordii]|uniref:Transcription factor DIVARICATA-like n=1 Tax=Tripterygium wilfordii TaxID=458696 RepID=A0A7J7E1M7_TRIWF|nr:transcription factor DIVARICATA-like [Tripterygium wilfordii]KAF5752550.1 transcription factor DIVARICATA-like [Tripterygium wilfordii]